MFPTHLFYSFDVLLWRAQQRRSEDDETRRRCRRDWIHPITAARMTHGVHSTLYAELHQHPEKFANYLRMSVETFDNLLPRISERICCQDTHLRRSISPEERLIVTLRILASGESFSLLHFRLGISTISGVVRTTCDALWDCLLEEYLPQPSAEHWLKGVVRCPAFRSSARSVQKFITSNAVCGLPCSRPAPRDITPAPSMKIYGKGA
ncbi:uncharacterized protein LOC130297319 [Hyla sarda]|uniref:uncharacterized protein LOC130297319 n=1 Tax=Hyla sarda TaxID=327740 RepID=UPI0024C3328D|nr:uncharacterized protein LOC130297319 [Hyla sarda]